jgi:8-oxo-dGTP diphosphatase
MEYIQRVAGRALIIHDGKILIIRESNNYDGGTNKGKYDLPGGKLDPGEYFIDGLKREVYEETGKSVEIGMPFYVDEWRPTINGKNFQIIGIFFLCTTSDDKVKLSKDHDDYKWIDAKEYNKYPMIDAAEKAISLFAKINN